MDCLMLVLFLVVILALSLESSERNFEKRLLLNDPQQLQSQIDGINAKLRDLQGKYTDLQSNYTDLQTKYNDLNVKYANTLSQIGNKKGGALFTRWGREDCPSSTTETLYSGFTAGSWYNTTPGGGVNYLCLPRDPTLKTLSKIMGGQYLYGTEYTLEGEHVFGAKDGNDVPCAVCRSLQDTSLMVLPAKNTCYSGWTKQYSGYLATSYRSHTSSKDFICLDEHPQSLIAGERDYDGALVFPVLTVCGALACPPYHNNTYVLCAVCTK